MNSCDYALLFIGHKMQLAPLFLFFSIVGGLVAYGFIGVFLGPILLAILLTASPSMRRNIKRQGLSSPRPKQAHEGKEDKTKVILPSCCSCARGG